MVLMNRRYVPPPAQPTPPPTPCSRSCCWTPYGHSAQAENCRCHTRGTPR